MTIEISGLTKTYGPIRAVDDLSFRVRPGAVTGFLGPNGAGKTTTLRMLLGLATADRGTALIDGRPYSSFDRPMRSIGAALEASFHPGRTGRDHLRVYAPFTGADDARCDEVLAQVGLTDAGRRRVGGYSLGMRQRLALAAALLGDPRVLVLDEPANGLDPEGIVWLRGFLRYLAHEEGRTVLISSHVLGEVQASVDDVVLIAHGRLVHESSLTELVAMAAPRTRVAGPDAAALSRLVADRGWSATITESAPLGESAGLVESTLLVEGVSPAEVGAAAFAAGVELHELAAGGGSLEQVFLELTGDVGVPVPDGRDPR